MASIGYSENFLNKRADVLSDRTLSQIDCMLRTIEFMPGVGSSLVSESLTSRYGSDILKVLVSPYLILYRYDRDTDTVSVYDLVYAPSVH